MKQVKNKYKFGVASKKAKVCQAIHSPAWPGSSKPAIYQGVELQQLSVV